MRRFVPLVLGVIAVAFAFPFAAYALTYDVGILQAGVTFTPSPFFVGERVRIYTMVRNFGDRDVEGSVFVSENGTTIGTPPPFSAKARGAEEEVWVEWQPGTVGERQIFVRVVNTPEQRDEDPTNNEMIVPVYVDRDADGDRIGDREDPDDDNDGLPDAWEIARGLNPNDPRDAAADPDGDGRSTIEEYRAGTDPFVAPPIIRGGGGGGGGGGSSGSGSPAPAPTASAPPTPAVKPVPSAPPRASVVGNRPSAPAPSAVAGQKIRAPANANTPPSPRAGGVVDPVAVATVTTTTDAAVNDPPSSVSPARRLDSELRALLGGSAGRWQVVVPIVAGIVALVALTIGVLLAVRRRARKSRGSDGEST